jgi:hypothetical protein
MSNARNNLRAAGAIAKHLEKGVESRLGSIEQRLENLGHSRPTGDHYGEQIGGHTHQGHAEAQKQVEAWAKNHMREHKGCTGSLENFYCPECKAPYTMIWWDEHGRSGEGHCPHTD